MNKQSYELWRAGTGCFSAILTAWTQEKVADPTHHPGRGQTSKGRDGARGGRWFTRISPQILPPASIQWDFINYSLEILAGVVEVIMVTCIKK